MIHLVTGGSGCGKSALAQDLTVSLSGGECCIYLATMKDENAESRARIEKHRRMRSDQAFETLELERGLEAVRERVRGRCVLLECMSNLLANEMFTPEGVAKDPAAAVMKDIEALGSARELVIVTGMADMGCDDRSGLTGAYLEELARINRELFAMSRDVLWVMCGEGMYLKKGGRVKDAVIPSRGIVVINGGHFEDERGYVSKKCGPLRPVLELEEWIREHQGEDRERLKDSLSRLLDGEGDMVVLCRESGCGVVPLAREDREHIETVGELRRIAAARAAAVIFLTCGVGIDVRS